MPVDDSKQRMEFISFQIDDIRKELQEHRERFVEIVERINRVHDRLNKYIDTNDEIRDVIGEKLFMMFYKVFPEAVEADKALERVVRAQKKKPKA